MQKKLRTILGPLSYYSSRVKELGQRLLQHKRTRSFLLSFFYVFFLFCLLSPTARQTILSPLSRSGNASTVAVKKTQYEVFGFAPYWTIKKLDNVDFDVLTTFAYFDL